MKWRRQRLAEIREEIVPSLGNVSLRQRKASCVGHILHSPVVTPFRYGFDCQPKGLVKQSQKSPRPFELGKRQCLRVKSLNINDLRNGSKGRTRTVLPIQSTRRIAVFPLKVEKKSPKLTTIFVNFSEFSLTVSLTVAQTA
jgi:hypothetical protein